MIRLHEVLLSLATAGIVAALVMSGHTGGDDRGWDTRESQAGLFHSQDAGSIRSSHLSTGPTLRKWAGTGFAPQVRVATFKPGQVRGVRVSLTSSPDMATAIQGMSQGPDIPNCFVSSVKNGGANTSCSTSADNSGDSSCSVTGVNGGSLPAQCSTTGGVGGANYCSANAEANGANPVACSASGTGGGANRANACSAGISPVGGNPTCSTSAQKNPGNGATNCSAGMQAGSTNTTCSVDAQSGAPNPVAASCSASNTDGNGGTGSCSVNTDGVGNKCSATQGSGSYCSVLSAGAMTCSIQASFNSASCTSNNPNGYPNSGSCSARGGAGGCSVIQAGGGVTGPNPATGYCGTP
jgi:hypothetical protein